MALDVRKFFYAIPFLIALNAQAWMNEASLAPGAFDSTVENANTYRILEVQAHTQESGNSNYARRAEYDQGKSRARQVVSLIRDKEVKQRMLELKPIGDRLKDNEYIQTPAKVVGVAAALWLGRSYRVMKDGGLTVDSRIEARAREGSIDVGSVIVNAGVKFRSGHGMALAINRTLPLLNSYAEVNYDVAEHCMNTALTAAVIDHFSIVVGAAQAMTAASDTSARILYQVVL